MNKGLIFSLSLLFISNLAQASHLQIKGRYQTDKSVPVMYIQSKEECVKEDGQWEDAEGDGFCLLKGSDSVEVTKNLLNYKIKVETIGNNAHSCSFEAKAKRKSNELISKVETEEYNMDTDKMEKVECVVTATFQEKKVSVTDNGHCQSFCGMNAYLETEVDKK